jgi:hypothetical protein
MIIIVTILSGFILPHLSRSLLIADDGDGKHLSLWMTIIPDSHYSLGRFDKNLHSESNREGIKINDAH